MIRFTSILVAMALLLPAPSLIADTDNVTPRGIDPGDAAKRLTESMQVLGELTTAPDDGIPKHLLERAEAIVVIPSLVKGGFIVGAKHGKGVVSVRDREASGWSAPGFVNMTGGSIGWQVGLEAVDLVLLVMNKSGVEELLGNRFTLGGAASVAAGPVGRHADAATDVQLEAHILAYSRAKGLFAGATFEGAALHSDDDANKEFYGRALDMRAVVASGSDVRTPALAERWQALLRRVSAPATF